MMRFVYHLFIPLTLALLLCTAAQPRHSARSDAPQFLSDTAFLPQVTGEFGIRLPLPAPRSAELLFAGDLMQHMPQVIAARTSDGSFDYTPCFRYVKPRFERAGLAVVNLETTLTASPTYTGYPCFRSPAALARALKELGVDVCVLANNHCCDGGAAGVRTTLAELDRCGIAHTGVFADSTDYRAHHPLRMMAGCLRVALLNYTYGTNGISVPQGIIVNRIDTAVMTRDLRAARNGETDCVVVVIHWGNEYERRPNVEQRQIARFLRRHGADIVIGSHPHVIQPYEADSAGVTFYSLGNFVSNQRKRYCDGGLLAEVRVTQRFGRPLAFDVNAIPVWVLLPGYRILPPEAADTMLMPTWVRTQYDRFRNDTRVLLDQ